MSNIAIVLSGGAGKGVYEIGCLQAIVDHFGKDSIKYVSSASIGSLVGQTFGTGQIEELKQMFRDIDNGKYGRFNLGLISKKHVIDELQTRFATSNELCFEHYVSIWNLTKSTVEYIPFHKLPPEEVPLYLQGAMSIPIFCESVPINGCKYYDGAFLDNIPVSPLLDKDIDYVFCIYFDNYKYTFETPKFDKKVIKLFDFPNSRRMEILMYKHGTFEEMYEYGYNYADSVIKEIFKEIDNEKVYMAIANYNVSHKSLFKSRLTADVVLNNINTMTQKYSKSKHKRKKHSQR